MSVGISANVESIAVVSGLPVTKLFFPDVQFEKEQNLDTSLLNLDSKP